MKEKQLVITPEYGEMLIQHVTKQRPLKEGGVQAIAASIRDFGWNPLSYIGIEDDGEQLVVRAGQHRLHALKLLGWPKIKANIRYCKPGEVSEAFWMADNIPIPQNHRDNMAMLEHTKTHSKIVQTSRSFWTAYTQIKSNHKVPGTIDLIVTRNIILPTLELLTWKSNCKMYNSAIVLAAFCGAMFYTGEAEYYAQLHDQLRTGLKGEKGDYSVVKSFCERLDFKSCYVATTVQRLTAILVLNKNRTRNTIPVKAHIALANEIAGRFAAKYDEERVEVMEKLDTL